MELVEGEENKTDALEPDVQTDRSTRHPRTRACSSSITERNRLAKNAQQQSEVYTRPGPAMVTDHNAVAVEAGGCQAKAKNSLGTGQRMENRKLLSAEVNLANLRMPSARRILQPPWRSGVPSPPVRSLTGASPGPAGWMRRSESTCTVNSVRPVTRRCMRPATSLPHIARLGGGKTMASPSSSVPRVPCLLVALRPINLEEERQAFFQSDYHYEPQFKYSSPEPSSVLEKYREGSGLFLAQAVGILECVLTKFGSYENFEEVTGGKVLPKSRVWTAVRKYLQKEGCVGEVVVCLSEELLSQAVMMVESCRPTLTINLSGARQHWLEGMLRHEIGTHYLRGVNNNQQPWSTTAGRKQFGLKPANPTEEGLPYLWRAALLYYTVYHATSMSFSQLFHHIGHFVQDPAVRWEYCLRAKRGQTDTSKPGCFSKDQVYLDGILRILRHRRNIDFKMLTSLGKVSYEDVEKLRHQAVLHKTRIPHFMQDEQSYLQHLDYIVEVNELDDTQLQELIS
uniref:KIAA0895 like n=1 Tax=Denticeps clupeoides TaxID=299321 RepID=A0AAY4DPZ5_9TELE